MNFPMLDASRNAPNRIKRYTSRAETWIGTP
jgi:hypothetical protein